MLLYNVEAERVCVKELGSSIQVDRIASILKKVRGRNFIFEARGRQGKCKDWDVKLR